MRQLLLVEDDSGIRLSLLYSLRAAFEITDTDSAVAALRIIEDGKTFDAIITDVSLIEGKAPSGISVATAARARLPGAKIVVMSAQKLSEVTQALIEDIGATFLEKPFRIAELTTVLK